MTGKTTYGFSGEKLDPPAALKSRLPDPSLEPWAANNCAEVAACSRQLFGINDFRYQQTILERLEIFTVRTKTGEYAPPCSNCATWVPWQ